MVPWMLCTVKEDICREVVTISILHTDLAPHAARIRGCRTFAVTLGSGDGKCYSGASRQRKESIGEEFQ